MTDGPPQQPSSTLGDATPDGPYNHLFPPCSDEISDRSLAQPFPDSAAAASPLAEAQPIRRRPRHNSGDSGICDSSEARSAIGESERSDAGKNLSKDEDAEEMNERRIFSCGCMHSPDTTDSAENDSTMADSSDPTRHDLVSANQKQDRCFHNLAKFANLRQFAQSPMRQSKRVPDRRSPYLSPLLAPDALLSRLPPIHLVVSAPGTRLN